MTTNPDPKARGARKPIIATSTEVPSFSGSEESQPKSRSHLLFGQRRHIIVDPGYQYRAITLPVMIAVPTVCILLFALIRILVATSTTAGPDLGVFEGLFHPDTRIWWWSGIGAGITFSCLLIYLELMGTHRSAGAVYQVKRTLKLVAAGNLSRKVGLRTHDHFQDLAAETNLMLDTLQDERRKDLEAIQKGLSAIGHVRPQERDDISRTLATAWDALVSMKRRKEGLD